ncbi:hypothetical protein [Enhygromyxa salina]|uniref:Uncharacterized protein n=1 Tax=Enhygromyxa salina TaxID=215803 RepID=A0A2S9YKN1_9BACT|nr:hypothetical protein [Enhygromyxa salina]PRQ05643.1 hypothetical protein ENSA7_45330 [Enhygromyxa salina]
MGLEVKARVVFTLTSVAAAACNFETKDPNSEVCTEIPGLEDCDLETPETGDDTGGGGETGDDDPAELPSGHCRHNPVPNLDEHGWRFQCEGHLYASIAFDAPLDNDCEDLLGDRCHEHHVFGPSSDSYESPGVMACCGEYDPSYKNTYFQYCEFDIVQQVCISMAKRLEKLVEDGSFGAYAGQGAKLQQWIATNYKSCFEELRTNDTISKAGEIASSWSIPNSAQWPDFDNFVISIDEGTLVSGIIQPSDPADWLSCFSALDNNDEIFEDAVPPSGGVTHGVDLDSGVAGSLVGPVALGGQVTATVSFSPECVAKGCSRAELWRDATSGATLVVQDITLFTGSFSVDNGNGVSMLVDSARVSLYESAQTTPIYDAEGQLEAHVIQPGDAFFLFSGSAANVHDHYLASNATAITISQVQATWQLDPFEVRYVDERGQTWTLALGPSTWR